METTNTKVVNTFRWYDLFILLWLFLMLVLSVPILFPNVNTKVSIIVTSFIQIVVLIIHFKIRNIKLISDCSINIPKGINVSQLLLLGITIAVTIDSIDRLVNKAFPLSDEFQSIFAKLLQVESGFELFLLILGVGVLVPIVEEVYFRGVFMKYLIRRNGVTSGIVFSSMLFALCHFNPFWIFQLVILGVLLGWLAWKSKSVVTVIVIHAFVNTWTIVLSLLPEDAISLYLWNDVVSPLATIAAVLGVIYILKRI